MITIDEIKNQILFFLTENKFNPERVISLPVKSMKRKDFLKIFYRQNFKKFFTHDSNKNVIIYGANYDYFLDILFFYPENRYFYITPNMRDMEFLKRKQLNKRFKIDSLFGFGEYFSGKEYDNRFDYIILFDDLILDKEMTMKNFYSFLKDDGKLIIFSETSANFSEITYILKKFEKKRETRGRKPKYIRKKRVRFFDSNFKFIKSKEWKSYLTFDKLLDYLLFIFSTSLFEGISIEDNIDYFSKKIYSLYERDQALRITVNYDMKVYEKGVHNDIV